MGYDFSMNASYLCIGQLRLEWLSEVERLPQKNQSVAALGSEVKLAAGVGTDAIKIARLGKPVHLIGRIGRDAVGDFILNMLRHEGVNTTFVRRTVNCKSHYRQLLQAADGDLIEVMNQSEGCRLTVDDVLAAQALVMDRDAVFGM
jgi:ribokinase